MDIKNTNQKGNTLTIMPGIIIVVLITGALFGAYYLGTLKNSNPKNQQATIIPVSSQTPNETYNWKPLSLNNLTYKIPPTWWDYKPESQTKTISIFLNPTPLPIPGDNTPAFIITWVGKKTINQEREEAINNWGLTDIKEESVTIAGNKGIILTGMTNSSVIDSFKQTVILIPNSEEMYTVLDFASITDHEKLLNQILSTFKFTN